MVRERVQVSRILRGNAALRVARRASRKIPRRCEKETKSSLSPFSFHFIIMAMRDARVRQRDSFPLARFGRYSLPGVEPSRAEPSRAESRTLISDCLFLLLYSIIDQNVSPRVSTNDASRVEIRRRTNEDVAWNDGCRIYSDLARTDPHS